MQSLNHAFITRPTVHVLYIIAFLLQWYIYVPTIVVDALNSDCNLVDVV